MILSRQQWYEQIRASHPEMHPRNCALLAQRASQGFESTDRVDFTPDAVSKAAVDKAGRLLGVERK